MSVSSPHAATFEQQSQPNQSPHSSKIIKPPELPLQSVRPTSPKTTTLTLLDEEAEVDAVEEETERVEAKAEAMADAHQASLEHVPIKTSD